MNQFNLENQYQIYLQLVNLNESTMSPIQRTETRRAFMAGCGQMLVLMRDEVGALEENAAINAMENMLQQAANFWTIENISKN